MAGFLPLEFSRTAAKRDVSSAENPARCFECLPGSQECDLGQRGGGSDCTGRVGDIALLDTGKLPQATDRVARCRPVAMRMVRTEIFTISKSFCRNQGPDRGPAGSQDDSYNLFEVRAATSAMLTTSSCINWLSNAYLAILTGRLPSSLSRTMVTRRSDFAPSSYTLDLARQVRLKNRETCKSDDGQIPLSTGPFASHLSIAVALRCSASLSSVQLCLSEINSCVHTDRSPKCTTQRRPQGRSTAPQDFILEEQSR